jgi:hypothetical protein
MVGARRNLRPRFAKLAVAVAFGLVGASCLPADTRPPAGSVLLTATSGDEPLVITADGWSIAVDRLLIGIGFADFDPPCDRYSDSQYDRLLDATLPKEQKVSITYGLGRCPFRFAMASPSSDTVLGEGVTEDDRVAMGGLWEPGPDLPPVGITVNFAATAARGAETKRMSWRFLQFTTYDGCSLMTPEGTPLPLELHSDENLAARITIRGATLFSDDAKTTAALRFDPMAAADTTLGNGDGEVTLDELGNVKLDEIQNLGPYGGYVGPSPGSLEDYLYLVLLPRIVELGDTFVCQVSLHGPRPHGPPRPQGLTTSRRPSVR